MRLWVDNQPLVNNWTEHASTENSGQITLLAGIRYNIRMEFFEGVGDALSQLSWSSASQPKQVIPQSQLYPSTTTTPVTTVAAAAMARLDAGNRTGGSDLFSGNHAWSLPLVSLPGRAGLNLGLSLAYNSLVWTKAGENAIVYDADNGYPSPGFRLGFPTIQPSFFNTQTSKSMYMLITPSGARVELRQTGTSNVYESVDSSYLQLTEYGASLLLRTIDGTQLTFARVDGEYVCTQVKDANGNFMSVSYNADGDLKDVTDTLGRKLVFVYDQFQNLQKITQVMNSGTANQRTHEWATFGFGDAQTVTSDFTTTRQPVGVVSGASIPVLRQIGLADGSYFKFRYTTHGQVDRITRYAPNSNPVTDDHPLSYSSYTLVSDGADCPRATERRDWAENWSGVHGVPNEAVTTYTKLDEGTREVTLPNGTTKHKEYFHTGGWARGLSYKTEMLDGGSVKKTTTAQWTQDNTNLAYPLNPRVFESTVEDSPTNGRRTTIGYTSYGLPTDIREYAKGGATPLRRTHTEYNIDPVTHAEYLNRRIIGLVREQTVHREEAAELMSKVTYEYDEQGDFLVGQTNPVQYAVQHDGAYNAGYKWRGLVTTARRWDTTNTATSTDITKAVAVQTGYNTQGSGVLTRQQRKVGAALEVVQTNISYADSFSGTTTPPSTFAYPTQVSLPEGTINYTSTSIYDYDTGQVTSAQTPMPSTPANNLGPVRAFTYDNANRLTGVSVTGGASTSYGYSLAGDWVKQSTKVNADKPLEPETSTTTVFDGAGRVRATSADHPELNQTTTGRYTGRITKYDVMGRAVATSNPAEMTNAWAPTGDDAAGLLYTTQTYDWKGRPLVTTHTDGTPTRTASKRTATYDGCGCAGGATVELIDEVGRKQIVTSDVLGRTIQVEDFARNATTSAYESYRTTTNNYNARDQITSIVQQATGGAQQTTTVEYDGHGRTWKSKSPEALTATINEYNIDDSLLKVTDARGATSLLEYNKRGLMAKVSYTTPDATNIPKPGDVTFGYDAAGNRTAMTDELGSMSYVYNALSQLTSESRSFTAQANPAQGDGKYTLGYEYTQSGALKKITDPFGASVDYTYDFAGRATAVSGSAFAGVTQYASEIKYRAWGGAKHLKYGDGLTMDVWYDVKLKPSSYALKNTAGTTVMGAAYEYENDGRLRFVDDALDRRLDRLYKYDDLGRVTSAVTGYLANGVAYNTDKSENGPYNHYYGYDSFDHLTSRTGNYWYALTGENYTAAYSNNRVTSINGSVTTGWVHDADGRVTRSQNTGSSSSTPYVNTYKYDAAGMRVDAGLLDGDGQLVKTQGGDKYYVRSSVLGGLVVSEVNSETTYTPSHRGMKAAMFVNFGGAAVAEQYYSYASGYQTEHIRWTRHDPARTSVHNRDDNRMPPHHQGGVQSALDIQGIATETPDYTRLQQNPSYYSQQYNSYNYGSYGIIFIPGGSSSAGGGMPGNVATYVLNGMVVPYDFAILLLGSGAARQCPNNNCNPRAVTTVQPNGDRRTVIRPLQQDHNGFYVNAPYLDYSTRVRFVERASGVRSQFRDGPNANFNSTERGILRQAENRILSSDCERWINEKLAALALQKKNGQLQPDSILHNNGASNLRDLLKQAMFNKFSSSLTAEQMSVNELDRQNIMGKVGAAGVTVQGYYLLEEQQYRQVYLYDRAFSRTNSYGLGIGSSGIPLMGGTIPTIQSRINVDTASWIVHELFHVAGYTDTLIDNKEFLLEIKEHCGLSGTLLGKYKR